MPLKAAIIVSSFSDPTTSFVSIVTFPSAGTTNENHTSYTPESEHDGIVELVVAPTEVAVTGLVSKVVPIVNGTAPAQTSFATGVTNTTLDHMLSLVPLQTAFT
ncbi:hypothetical protein D9M70_621280 [compost metagenome]